MPRGALGIFRTQKRRSLARQRVDGLNYPPTSKHGSAQTPGERLLSPFCTSMLVGGRVALLFFGPLGFLRRTPDQSTQVLSKLLRVTGFSGGSSLFEGDTPVLISRGLLRGVRDQHCFHVWQNVKLNGFVFKVGEIPKNTHPPTHATPLAPGVAGSVLTVWLHGLPEVFLWQTRCRGKSSL